MHIAFLYKMQKRLNIKDTVRFTSFYDRESNAYNRVNEETLKELRCPTETDQKMS
jgi:hypothetical protein